MLSTFFMSETSTNVSNWQIAGGSTALVVLGAIGMWLLKAIPVINEERKKFRSGTIEEWEKFSKKQTEEIDRLKIELQQSETRFMQRMSDQESRFRECAEQSRKMQSEIDRLKSELTRLESLQKNSIPPVVMTSAEVIIDEKGTIVSASEGFIPLLGTSPSDMIGQTFSDYLSMNTKGIMADKIAAIRAPEHPKMSELVEGFVIHAIKQSIKASFIISKMGLDSGQIRITVVLRK